MYCVYMYSHFLPLEFNVYSQGMYLSYTDFQGDFCLLSVADNGNVSKEHASMHTSEFPQYFF